MRGLSRLSRCQRRFYSSKKVLKLLQVHIIFKWTHLQRLHCSRVVVDDFSLRNKIELVLLCWGERYWDQNASHSQSSLRPTITVLFATYLCCRQIKLHMDYHVSIDLARDRLHDVIENQNVRTYVRPAQSRSQSPIPVWGLVCIYVYRNANRPFSCDVTSLPRAH